MPSGDCSCREGEAHHETGHEANAPVKRRKVFMKPVCLCLPNHLRRRHPVLQQALLRGGVHSTNGVSSRRGPTGAEHELGSSILVSIVSHFGRSTPPTFIAMGSAIANLRPASPQSVHAATITPLRLESQDAVAPVRSRQCVQRAHGSQQDGEQRRVVELQRGQQDLRLVSFLRRCEARRAIVRYHRQLIFLGKRRRVALPDIQQGPAHAHILLLYPIIGFHRPQQAIVNCTHEERLSEVIQMLTQNKHIVPIVSHAGIQHSSLHS
mmetsp:Transcript_32550/g.107322  ORF Transcript_32550/g.107322 Transcript_32550/m.107322 type:complete len:266 (+) Transcript_32550:139-936(+)